ncbi:2'-deoxycytidine 5'-triphosphate deaminase [Methylobacterium sp.]|uniref:2'-deoxycytidine 5'-triphosphate deaminase n=1 Tax=Methylobacterium sp. TaxID=409 RepID=UPI000C5E81CF|nr:2'-deoxycytidine 5'-triphosphate deaminase [Methylobacterium sp.]MBP28920.1 2'-deoxycytidine 5'-triphosphate deaminase [Methylobacterium sp.]
MPFAIWPSQRISAAIAAGTIRMEVAPDHDQVQPASLDLRLGSRAYRLPASFLPGPGRTVAERLVDLATHEVDLTTPTVLERNCVHIIPLMEGLALPKGIDARANPKSSSGRLDLFVRVITDYGTTFDDVPEGYQGPLYAEVVPRSFAVIAQAGARLAQIRFREAVAGDRSTSRIVPVSVDLDPEGKPGGIIGYRARRHAGLVDLSRVGALPRSDYWEPITATAGRRELILDPDEFYILASAEAVVVGAEEAAEMVAYDTSVGELRAHYAGYLDCGFGLAEAGGSGSRVVLEVRSHDVPFLLEHGQRVATLVYEPMSERPERLYGADAGSNYQGQGLKLSKHFM